MIYQKIKDMFSNNQKLTSDFIKDEISQVIKNETNPFPQLVEDLIFLYIENKSNVEREDVLSKSFYHLFVNGLTWSNFQEIEITTKRESLEKKEFINLELKQIKELLRKPFEGHFIHEFSQDPIKFKKMAFKLFGLGICTNDKLEIIGEILNLPKNEEIFEELLLATRNFSQMKQISSVFKIEPFMVIKKNSDIQTLWPTYVWQMENSYSTQQERTPWAEKERIFLTGLNVIKKIETDKTSNIDFKSRIVFASCNLNSEHHYADFLRELGINDINLNCIDYVLSKPFTLKERLLKCGKIKIINKYEKDQNIEVPLSQIITAVPNKPDLISNKRGFVKQFVKNLPEHVDYTQLLIDVLATKYRKYSNSPINLKCYVPLKPESLDKPKVFWKSNKIRETEFITFGESTGEVPIKSFINLLYWLQDKPVNWLDKTPKGNSLISEAIIASMQFPLDVYVNELADTNNTLLTSFKKLSIEDKKAVLEEIKNSWDKVWDDVHEKNHSSYILYTPYKRPSNTFIFMNKCLEYCLQDGIKYEKEFFDEKWNAIKKKFTKYETADEHGDAKQFLILANTLELQSTLVLPETRSSSKLKKI